MWWAGFVCFAWVIGRYSVFSPVFVLLLSFCLLFFVESRGFGGFWGGYCGFSGLFRGPSVILVSLMGVWCIFCALSCLLVVFVDCWRA